MKRKIAILLTLTMAAGSLLGCGDSKGGAAVGSTEQKETGGAGSVAGGIFTGELEKNVTIRVLENDTAIQKGYFKELIQAFNETYKEYGITAVDANMDQYLDLANDGPYGYGPDVLYQANDVIMKYAEGKHIYPLPVDQLESYNQTPKQAWDAYEITMDGTTYTCGVPVNVQAPMLYYRKDMLPENWESEWDDDQNGVPDMVENWNAMYRYSIARHEEDASRYGYMKSLDDPYFALGYLFSYGGYVFGESNTNPEDIGFSAGEAEKGADVLLQQASVMSEESIDNTVTISAYNKIANGTYFATMTTPDVYSTFIDELVLQYESEGMSKEEAKTAATENLVMAELPKLPKSGDLAEEAPELFDMKAMGGINGYAVSAYTKAPNACLAFIDFASNYEMVTKRSEMLGVAPARKDAAEAAGGVSEMLYENLESGNIVLMPSVQAASQIWTPAGTFFVDLAKDAFRPEREKKYKDREAMKEGLKQVDAQVYDAIFTLK